MNTKMAETGGTNVSQELYKFEQQYMKKKPAEQAQPKI